MSASAANSPPSLAEGTVIDGRYRVTQRIGRGGFAWVYEGEHVDLGRSAAIKVLDAPAPQKKDEFVERFLREARIIARLSHPNVVSVYDFGIFEETDQPYIAMELLNGHDLEHELAVNGPMEGGRAKKLFLGALHALRAAHASGVVHKDLKPSNLYIAQPGQPDERLVLLDFGIAWAFDDDGRMTKVGTFTGTPAYVAPEYARDLRVSPAVDVYQIGLILSEALSCTPCVAGVSSVQLILAHCQGDIHIADQVLASEFGAVIKKATAIDPSVRYVNGGAFAAALERVDPSTMPPMRGRYESNRVRTAEHLYSNVHEGAATLTDAPSAERAVAATTAKPKKKRTDKPPPDPRENEQLTTIWYLAGVVGLIVIGVIAFNYLEANRLEDEPIALATTPSEPPTMDLKSIAPPEPVGLYLEPDASDARGELALTPRFVISSDPIGAAVFIGDELLGRTPVVLRGDRVDGSKTKLRVELHGYHSRSIEADLLDGQRVDLEMKSSRPAVTPPPAQQNPIDMLKLMRSPEYLKASREAAAEREREQYPQKNELILD